MKKFKMIHNESDRSIEVELDGKYFASANYDDDAWSGLENLENLIHKFISEFPDVMKLEEEHI